jgi:hypothetical protein
MKGQYRKSSVLINTDIKMFGHQINFPSNFSSHGASYPEKLATSLVSFIMDHPVPTLPKHEILHF